MSKRFLFGLILVLTLLCYAYGVSATNCTGTNLNNGTSNDCSLFSTGCGNWFDSSDSSVQCTTGTPCSSTPCDRGPLANGAICYQIFPTSGDAVCTSGNCDGYLDMYGTHKYCHATFNKCPNSTNEYDLGYELCWVNSYYRSCVNNIAAPTWHATWGAVMGNSRPSNTYCNAQGDDKGGWQLPNTCVSGMSGGWNVPSCTACTNGYRALTTKDGCFANCASNNDTKCVGASHCASGDVCAADLANGVVCIEDSDCTFNNCDLDFNTANKYCHYTATSCVYYAGGGTWDKPITSRLLGYDCVANNVWDKIPTQGTPILNSTYNTNTPGENLTCYNQSTSNAEAGQSVKNIYTWQKGTGKRGMNLNMPFEGNYSRLYDFSGFKNSGTVTGTALRWANNTGHDGKGAYTFTGATANYISIAHKTYFNGTKNLTVSLWKNPANVAKNNFDVAKMGTSLTAPDWKIGMSNTIANFTMYDTTPTAYVASCSGSYYGAWHHLAGVYFASNGSMRLYVDGVLCGTAQFSGTHNAGINALIIGAKSGSTNAADFSQGIIDDVRIYNYTMTGAEIKMIYQDKTNVIDSAELAAGQAWTCNVTPVDTYFNGSSKAASSLTITSLANGNSCTLDAECTSGNCDQDFAGSPSYCHATATSCVDYAKGGDWERATGYYLCSGTSYKLCTGSAWGSLTACSPAYCDAGGGSQSGYASATCTSGTSSPCGTGTCTSCSPYMAASTSSCKTSCTLNSDCWSGYSCLGSVCTASNIVWRSPPDLTDDAGDATEMDVIQVERGLETRTEGTFEHFKTTFADTTLKTDSLKNNGWVKLLLNGEVQSGKWCVYVWNKDADSKTHVRLSLTNATSNYCDGSATYETVISDVAYDYLEGATFSSYDYGTGKGFEIDTVNDFMTVMFKSGPSELIGTTPMGMLTGSLDNAGGTILSPTGGPMQEGNGVPEFSPVGTVAAVVGVVLVLLILKGNKKKK